jgi:hypothetical protein
MLKALDRPGLNQIGFTLSRRAIAGRLWVKKMEKVAINLLLSLSAEVANSVRR